jgi:stress response protein YsnF
MAHHIDTVLGWRGETVVDRDGEKIGSLKELYLDQDDRPAWGAVDTGLFGLRQTFVPIVDARPVDGGIQVPFAKEHVKDAPSIEPDEQLSSDEERRLYRHYELPAPDDADDEGRPAEAGRGDTATADEPVGDDQREPGARAADVDAGTGDDAPDAMTRSEEELVVGTRRRVRGKARLKKYVVTEHVQRTIPVQREEVRVEYEPAEGGEAADEHSDAADGPSRDRSD